MGNLLTGRLPGELMVPVKNRMSFLYLEYGQVVRETNSISWRSGVKEFDLPVGNLAALLLGSGSSITQAAAAEIARFGCNVSFVYGAGVGTHACFLSGSTQNARLLEQQVSLRSENRLSVARQMYKKRWDNDLDVSSKSINEMRGIEGFRMKTLYQSLNNEYGFESVLRDNKKKNFDSSSLINQQITALYQVLYGISNSVILSLGLHPSLGFIHQGHSQAFVFDIADLYKERFLPLAYSAAKDGRDPSHMRATFRDAQLAFRLIPTIVDDVLDLLRIRVTNKQLDDITDTDESMLLGDQ